jgi:hypothetical protein
VAGHRGLVDDFLESAGDRADQIELVSNLMIVGDGPVNEVAWTRCAMSCKGAESS